MNFRIDTTKKAQSTFICEEYFPAIIEFSSEELNNHFMEFNFQDSDMFELSVHPKTNALKRFTLTLCNHYEIIDEQLDCPPCEEGLICIDGPDSCECKTFVLKVYNNGAALKISDVFAERYIKSGHLIFALSKDHDIVGVYLTGLSEQQITHIKTELTI